ncbi:MAG: (Fe-S)-binding protein [Ferroplasma sp.]|uniref:(Fe-S)-binding protein n=1 Tax=Ferroplasma sp. TaxID=2591003 RepID=UPI002814A239|nr:(Fe-S)-binding protein [Ferroplasma sp.]WMT50395.1 MAG: (Fe-S)-binding protein [Ferroplasma sp.]
MNLIKEIENITDKCISCGFCESVCPTLGANQYNSVFGARGRVILADFALKNPDNDLELGDSFYSCLDCYACVNVCPAGVNAGVVSELMREFIVTGERGQKNPVAALIRESIMKYESPLGLKREAAEWADGIRFQKSSTVIITGHMYQMMPYTRSINRIRKHIDERVVKDVASAMKNHISLIKLSRHFYDKKLKMKMDADLRNIVDMLKKSGVEFGYLGENEPYPGMFLYDLGYTDDFREYARKFYNFLRKRGVKRIITVDPHTHDLLLNVYPEYVPGFDIDVIYYTDLLNLNYRKFDDGITVQEPCHMVLHNNGFRAVDILTSITDVRMPERNGKLNMCCGGPDELLFPDTAGGVSVQRYRELKEKSDNLVTICPLCYNNLAYDSKVKDFSEFVKEMVID